MSMMDVELERECFASRSEPRGGRDPGRGVSSSTLGSDRLRIGVIAAEICVAKYHVKIASVGSWLDQ